MLERVYMILQFGVLTRKFFSVLGFFSWEVGCYSVDIYKNVFPAFFSMTLYKFADIFHFYGIVVIYTIPTLMVTFSSNIARSIYFQGYFRLFVLVAEEF